MWRRRNQWLAFGGVVAVAVGASFGIRPSVDAPFMAPYQGLERAMMPAIIAYLQSPAYRDHNGDYPSAAYEAGRVKWLCAASLVFIDPVGTRWRAGMDVACGEYHRSASAVIIEGGGDMGHAVMVLADDHGRFQVLTAAQEPGVVPDPAWIGQNFPASAAADVADGDAPMAATPDGRALLAFGCTTRSAQGSLISTGPSGSDFGWYCTSR